MCQGSRGGFAILGMPYLRLHIFAPENHRDGLGRFTVTIVTSP
jgi:hypothetical protein